LSEKHHRSALALAGLPWPVAEPIDRQLGLTVNACFCVCACVFDEAAGCEDTQGHGCGEMAGHFEKKEIGLHYKWP
jgi:hypothetical protein